MELQDLSPHLLISQFRFQTPVPRFFDIGGALIDELRDVLDLQDWTYNQNLIELFSADRRDLFRVAPGEVYASLENFNEFSSAQARLRSFLEAVLGRLGAPVVNWIGVRTHDLAPVDSFDELKNALFAWLSEPMSSIPSLVGKQPTDVGWVLEFHGADPRVSVRFGPMHAAQARTTLFRDQEEGHFPPEFLFLDIDRVLADNAFSTDDAIDRWATSLDRNRVLVGGLAEWFSTLE